MLISQHYGLPRFHPRVAPCPKNPRPPLPPLFVPATAARHGLGGRELLRSKTQKIQARENHEEQHEFACNSLLWIRQNFEKSSAKIYHASGNSPHKHTRPGKDPILAKRKVHHPVSHIQFGVLELSLCTSHVIYSSLQKLLCSLTCLQLDV